MGLIRAIVTLLNPASPNLPTSLAK